MSRAAAILLLLLSMRLAVPDSVEARGIDTLSYFDPDSLESVAYTGDVLDLAVHFQVPAGWQCFGIRELEVLIPGPQTAHLGDWLYVCSFDDSLQPGNVIDSVQVTIQDNPSSSPLWTLIDLSGIATLQSMTEDFWVRGPALFTGLIDNSIPSGHSYWYVVEPGQTRWGPSADIPLRAVVQDQSDSLAWLEYFPHSVGDKWFYRITGPYTGQERLELVEVIGDTVMRNDRTYKHFRTLDYSTGLYRSQFFRIDTGIKYIFEFREVLDTLLCPAWEIQRFDFWPEIPFDSTMQCNGYHDCLSWQIGQDYICRFSGKAPIGIDTISAPYYTFRSPDIVDELYTFSKGFGLTYWHADEILIITGELVSAEISGIHYGEPFATRPQPDLPAAYRLSDPYPNPFNPATTIRYELPHAAQIALTIYDLLGREVATLVEGHIQSGTHEAVWDAGMLSSGIYLARLVTPGYSKTIKLVLLK